MQSVVEMIVSFAVAFYIAWGIGANDETMAIVASGTSWSIKKIAILGAAATFLGAVLFGQIVEKTVGTEILRIQVTSQVGLIILLSTAVWLTVVSWLGWPISTSHSTVGAVIGYGLLSGGLQAINLNCFSSIFWSWLLSPLIGLFTSYMGCQALNHFTKAEERTWLYLLLFNAFLMEFWQGANNVANATAFLSVTFPNPFIPRTVGGIGIALGLIILGRRVIFSAGARITRLPTSAAFISQLSIVLINAVGTIMGLPLSGTHISVSCLVGAGLAMKTKINYRVVKYVILAWFLTLPGAALVTGFVKYISALII